MATSPQLGELGDRTKPAKNPPARPPRQVGDEPPRMGGAVQDQRDLEARGFGGGHPPPRRHLGAVPHWQVDDAAGGEGNQALRDRSLEGVLELLPQRRLRPRAADVSLFPSGGGRRGAAAGAYAAVAPAQAQQAQQALQQLAPVPHAAVSKRFNLRSPDEPLTLCYDMACRLRQYSHNPTRLRHATQQAKDFVTQVDKRGAS